MSQLEDLARLSGDCEGKVEVKCSAVFQALMDLRVRYRVCPCSLHMGMRDAQIQLWITERTVTRQQAWVTLRFGGNKDEKKKHKEFSPPNYPPNLGFMRTLFLSFSPLYAPFEKYTRTGSVGVTFMKFHLELIYYTNLSGTTAGVYTLIPESLSSESRPSEDRLTRTHKNMDDGQERTFVQ